MVTRSDRAELFRQFLRDELSAIGINPDEIVALKFSERSPSRRRARLVRVERIQPEPSPMVRKIGEPSAIFHVTSVPISATRNVLVWRQGEQIALFEVRIGTGWSRPRTKRVIAQKLPNVRVRKVKVERIIVSTPSRTSVLQFPNRQPSIALSVDLLKSEPKVRVRVGRWETLVEGVDWKMRLRVWRAKYPIIERLWNRIEVASALVPEPKWVRLTDLM